MSEPTNPLIEKEAEDTALAIDGALALVQHYLTGADQGVCDQAAVEHGALYAIIGIRDAVKHLGLMGTLHGGER